MRPIVITIIFILSGLFLYAADPAFVKGGDSLLPVRTGLNSSEENEAINAELSNIEASYTLTGDNRKVFSRLLKITRLRASLWNKRLKARVFNDLAGVSARLKLYPLAMKCYYKAGNDLAVPDSVFGLSPDGDPLQDTVFDQQLSRLDSSLQAFAPSRYKAVSYPVRNEDIRASFEDGKTASAYLVRMFRETHQPL